MKTHFRFFKSKFNLLTVNFETSTYEAVEIAKNFSATKIQHPEVLKFNLRIEIERELKRKNPSFKKYSQLILDHLFLSENVRELLIENEDHEFEFTETINLDGENIIEYSVKEGSRIGEYSPRIFTFNQLSIISDDNFEKLNRCIDYIEFDSNDLYVLKPVMIHYHAFIEPVDAHLRTMVISQKDHKCLGLQDITFEQFEIGQEIPRIAC